jgi:hypothetical protein
MLKAGQFRWTLCQRLDVTRRGPLSGTTTFADLPSAVTDREMTLGAEKFCAGEGSTEHPSACGTRWPHNTALSAPPREPACFWSSFFVESTNGWRLPENLTWHVDDTPPLLLPPINNRLTTALDLRLGRNRTAPQLVTNPNSPASETGDRRKHGAVHGAAGLRRVRALLDFRVALRAHRAAAVPHAGTVDPQGCGVPDHQRRADAGWQPAAEPGVLRHHVDGARVRQAHPGLHQQELRRHGRVPRHHRAPGTGRPAGHFRQRPIYYTMFVRVGH